MKNRPRNEGDVHRLEVPPRRDALVGVDELLAGQGRASFNGDWPPREELAERQRGHAARGGNPGQRVQPFATVARRSRRTAPRHRRTSGRSSSARGQHAVRIEARRHALQASETAHEQASGRRGATTDRASSATTSIRRRRSAAAPGSIRPIPVRRPSAFRMRSRRPMPQGRRQTEQEAGGEAKRPG